MKSNVEVVGLPLMGIQDGSECGVVSDLIFSIEQKNVQYIVLDSGRGLFGLKILAFSKISGIGKDILTTQSSLDIKPLWEDKEAIALGFSSANILNARVISNDGNIAGRVIELFFDEKSGAIEQLVLDNGARVAGADILTLAAGSVFTSENVLPPPAASKPVKSSDKAPGNEPAADARAEQSAKPGDPSLSGLFQKRQLEYLIGREVTKDIKTKGGKTLAKTGDVVTEEMVLMIKEEGRMPELTLNVK